MAGLALGFAKASKPSPARKPRRRAGARGDTLRLGACRGTREQPICRTLFGPRFSTSKRATQSANCHTVRLRNCYYGNQFQTSKPADRKEVSPSASSDADWERLLEAKARRSDPKKYTTESRVRPDPPGRYINYPNCKAFVRGVKRFMRDTEGTHVIVVDRSQPWHKQWRELRKPKTGLPASAVTCRGYVVMAELDTERREAVYKWEELDPFDHGKITITASDGLGNTGTRQDYIV